MDSWFRTTASDLAKDASSQPEDQSFEARWRRGGFDHVEKYDDRVVLFATRLSEGRHEFSYLVRATTAGTFSVGRHLGGGDVRARGERTIGAGDDRR